MSLYLDSTDVVDLPAVDVLAGPQLEGALPSGLIPEYVSVEVAP